LLRAFSAGWRPQWRRGRGHDDTRTRPYPDSLANRAGGSRPDTGSKVSPNLTAARASPASAARSYRRRAAVISPVANSQSPRSLAISAPERSAQSAGSAEQATQHSKSFPASWQASPRPQTCANQVERVGNQRSALLPHSDAAGVGACPASVAVCAVVAPGGIIASPRIKDVASLAFMGGSVATARLGGDFLVRSVRKQEDASACNRCNYDRRETEAGGPRRPRNTRRIGSGLLVRGLVEAAQAVVPHPKRDCLIQVLGGALDYARWREPRLGATLRRHLWDHQPLCLKFLRAVAFRMLLSRQSQPDGTHSSPTYWLRKGAEDRGQLATTRRRDQATIAVGSC
jgi:hypothetical protein